MPHNKLATLLEHELATLKDSGRAKGAETVIRGIMPSGGDCGPRFLLEGEGEKQFLRMNSNNYLGLSFHAGVVAAEEAAAHNLGAGPGAVRFISGTWLPHIELERRLARFHDREAAMIFSSAYATVMGLIPPLASGQTAVLSDELNHNCIINAMRLARPQVREVYPHLQILELERKLRELRGKCRRVIIVTDGIFSMRGDHAPLHEINALAEKYDPDFEDNIVVIVDDSHGVGAFGETGRGTEEYTGSGPVDLLVGTLGKAFGVNGGYATGPQVFIDYLRETSPFYIYSNPITPAEAAAAISAIDTVDSDRGRKLLTHLRQMTVRFETGLTRLGHETIPGEHPIVPLMVRDTDKTSGLVRHLYDNGVLATGLNYPVVPAGEEEIRFQICADHNAADIDFALDVIGRFETKSR
jgi:glycine C-acetyltransferase